MGAHCGLTLSSKPAQTAPLTSPLGSITQDAQALDRTARVSKPAQEESSLASRLFEIAGYSGLSATAFMVKAKNTEKLVDKKVFIPVRLGKYRVIGMLDSGAGLTLMQHSLFKRLDMNESRLSRDNIPELKEFFRLRNLCCWSSQSQFETLSRPCWHQHWHLGDPRYPR